MTDIVVAAFYHFTPLPDYQDLREPLLECCLENGLRGTILLAAEGINGTAAGQAASIETLVAFLRSDPRLASIRHKESYCDEMPFYRMKVKLKKEIVSMGVPETDPANLVGTYLDAREWNEMLTDPDVIVIDTRNEYEVEIGSFPGAISPGTRSFREFPEFVNSQLDGQKDKTIAMFCTGGIRCEKATSFLKANGFEKVFHLQGGILNYLETVPAEQNQWDGECFVFDSRVAVDKNLRQGRYDMCHACRRPLSEKDKSSDYYVAGVSCSACYKKHSAKKRAGFAEREKQVALARARGQHHIGSTQGRDNDDG